jgi:hypothetical protein
LSELLIFMRCRSFSIFLWRTSLHAVLRHGEGSYSIDRITFLRADDFMTVVVSCRCGQRFAASEQLVGQQLPCPACGNLLSIGKASGGSQGIVVTCGCGRSFSAPESSRGQRARCPACGGGIQIPGQVASQVDPLSSGLSGFDGPLGPTLPLPTREPEIPWDKLKLIGGVGAILLVLVIATISILNAMRPKTEVAETTPAAPTVVPSQAPSNQPSANLGGSGAPPSAPPSAAPAGAPAESLSETPVVPVTSEKLPPIEITKLPTGVQEWYSRPGEKLTGIRRVNASDPPVSQFSWLTGLLPFLGHQKVYERFDFQAKLSENRNIQVGATLIPEFVNPLDDRQRWRGYPFDGIALSHFVGISGVEDARNVVAAKLPRSDPRAGVFGYDEVARPEEITDGKSQTIMVAGAGELANPWVFGGGATIRGAREPIFDKTSGFGTKGIAGGGTVVMMADGSVRQIHANVDPRVFKAMCTIRGAESVDLERSSQPFDLQTLREPKK